MWKEVHEEDVEDKVEIQWTHVKECGYHSPVLSFNESCSPAVEKLVQ
jgi:hypothetical protein